MAYAHTITYTPVLISGRRGVLVNIAETEGAAASEADVPLGAYIPSGVFLIKRITQVKSAGDAATTAPVFGTATNPASGTAAYIGTDAAAASHDTTNSGAGWVGSGLTLYWRSVPNAGVNNTMSANLYILEGWQA